jgi:PST family polysaccharide transporter
MDLNTNTLKQSAFVALKWNYLGMVVRAGSGLVIGIVLARLLGPAPFGLVAIATLIISLLNLVADFGFGSAIVQRADVSQADIRFVFSSQVLISAGLGAGCVVLSGQVARLFRTPAAAPIISVLALTFVLQAFGQTAASLLKRRLAFRAIQSLQVASYLAGYFAVGIPMAYLGFGVWSLVVAQLVQVFVNSFGSYMLAPHSIKPLLSLRYRSIIEFGGKVIGTNLVNWSIVNMDNAFIGRAFGAAPLGLYNRSFTLATMPFNTVVQGLQQVLFPAAARLQADRGALRKAYLRSFTALGMIMIPGFLALAAVGRTVILGLYGPKWADAAPMLGPLALAMPFYALMAIGGPILWAVGKVERELHAEAVTAALAVVGFGIAVRWSALVVAWVVLVIYAVRFLLVTRAVIGLLAVRWSELARVLRGPIALGVLAAATAYATKTILDGVSCGSVFRLVLVAGATIGIVIAVILIAPKAILDNVAVYESVPPVFRSRCIAILSTRRAAKRLEAFLRQRWQLA